jgi:SAM-dependent methyltransferase
MECRVCNALDTYLIMQLEESSWRLCRRCLLLQRTPVESSFADRYVFNEGYQWGVTTEGFSEEAFRERTAYIGRWWDFFANHVRLKENIRVLDLGSGTGALAEHLKHKKNVEVIGIEPSVKNEAFSRNRGHTVVRGFLRDGMFEEQTFDVMHLGNCGRLIPDVFQVFRIFHKILRTDGFIFLSDKEYHFSGLYPGDAIKRADGAFYFSKPALCNLMTLTGFEVVFYRNLFGEVKLIARKSSKPSVALRGSVPIELCILRMLPVIDILFDKVHRALLKLPRSESLLLKPLGRKLKFLP